MAKNTPTYNDDDDATLSGDFDSILDRSADEIKEPSRAPSGRWTVRCAGTYVRKTPEADLEENPELPKGKVIFYHTPDTPHDGVDPEAVERGDWRGKRIQTMRNVREESDFANILKFVRMHGVDTDGRSVKECLAAVKGRLIDATMSVNTYTRKSDGETVVDNQLGNFTPYRPDAE